MNYLLNDLLVAVFNHKTFGIKSGRSTIDLQDIIEKRLRAFEIITLKNVDVALLKLSENVERYNTQIGTTHLSIPYHELTQEEFNSLKEVML